MKRYEYHIIESGVGNIQNALTEMGAQGWRLVSNVPSHTHNAHWYCVTLEREITEDANFVRGEYDD